MATKTSGRFLPGGAAEAARLTGWGRRELLDPTRRRVKSAVNVGLGAPPGGATALDEPGALQGEGDLIFGPGLQVAERGADADHIVRLAMTGCPPTRA